MPERKAYSHTRLSQYVACPAQLGFTEAKAPQERGRPLLVGIVAHQAIEDYMTDCVARRIPSDVDAVARIMDGLSIDRKDVLPAQVDLVRAEVGRLVMDFAETYPVPMDRKLMLEQELAFTHDWQPTSWWGPQVRWRSKLDCLEVSGTQARIRDWKTGQYVPTEDEVREGGQLDRYALAVFKAFPDVTEVDCEYQYIRRRYTQAFAVHRDQAPAIQEEVEHLMAAADADDDKEAVPGPACGTCFYRMACQDYLTCDRRTATPDSTAELAALHYLLKARAKDVEAALKERLKVEGVITLPGGKKTLQYTGSTKWSIQDVQNTMGELLGLGVKLKDCWGALTLSKTKVESLLKKVWPGREGAAKRKDMLDTILKQHGVAGTENRLTLKAVKHDG